MILDFFETFKAIKHTLFSQLSEFRVNQTEKQIRMLVKLSKSLYSTIHNWVFLKALRKMEKQRRLIMKTDPLLSSIYTEAFSKAHRLLYLYMLKILQE